MHIEKMSNGSAVKNIVIVLIDDMGWTDLSCYGSSFYQTPRLDEFARQSVRFTQGYASCPVCSPTRASLMTGRYPASVGLTNWIPGNPWGKLMGVPYFHALPKDETTIAQVLKKSGRHTYHVGKWHLTDERYLEDKGYGPTRFGFDISVGGSHRGSPKTYFSPYKMPALEDGPDGEYLTDRLTDEAIALINRHSPGAEREDEPFFMYLAHYAVHTPIEAPEHLVEKYRKKAAKLGLDKKQALREDEPMPCLHKKGQKVTRRLFQSDPDYAAMMENLDTNVGRFFDALDAAGLTDDTLVIFTSDNGGLSTAEGSPTSNAPLSEGKGWVYEGGNRVCLMARWPGVAPAGQDCNEPVTTPDLYPTMLEAAGAKHPDSAKALDGVSIVPLLKDPQTKLNREGIFWHYPHYSNQGGTPACAIRLGDYKLIEFFEDNHLELYNLYEDKSEKHDLSEQQPDRTKYMHKLLKNWRQSIEAKIPERNTNYQAMLQGQIASPNGLGEISGDDHAV